MKDALYEDFSDPTIEFAKEPRGFCYDLASKFIAAGRKAAKENWLSDVNTINGVLLLLFTWNFAAKETKQLNFSNVSAALNELKTEIQLLENYSVMDIPDEVWDDVKGAFEKLRSLCGQTGASKALSLLNPQLFVMWDTKIRRRLRKQLIPGIANGQTGEQYVIFLKGVQKIIREYEIAKKLPPGSNVAKKLDEYHYVQIVMQGKDS